MAEAPDQTGPAGRAGRRPLRRVERERDQDGRPLNARPRDATGRPLARGSQPSWRERLAAQDAESALPPEEAIRVAEQLVLDGQPFYAHEVLEGPWHVAEAAERDFWQGLAQVAVGLTHVQRGNATGATALLRRPALGLPGRPPRCLGQPGHRPGLPAGRADRPRGPGRDLCRRPAGGVPLSQLVPA